MESVPAPLMSAPMEFRKLARSTMCGSLAAFSMVVVPWASAAAIMMFMVAPTDTTSRYTGAPTSRPFLAAVWIKPPSTDTSAPMVVKPLMCWSIGRTPKLQPPGMATVAWPKRPSSAPSR